MKKEEKEKKKLTLKEKLRDKRERAKLELAFYGIFFLIIIILVRVSSGSSPINIDNNQNTDSFINSLKDNYEYDIKIALNNNIYECYGKVLGNNSTINLKVEDKVKSYYSMNDKYYILENGNYILTNKEEIYPYVDYHYIDIKNIKQYINIAIKEQETFKVKVSDLILDSKSDKYISIDINEGDKTIIIDYTELLKLTKDNIEKTVVTITYNNIDNIISLDE